MGEGLLDAEGFILEGVGIPSPLALIVGLDTFLAILELTDLLLGVCFGSGLPVVGAR